MANRSLDNIRVNLIDDDEYLTRGQDDDIADRQLLSSVRQLGVIVPILVKPVDDRFCVIAGHRRFAAAKKAGIVVLPCYIFVDEENNGWSAAFAENMYRKNLSPIEEAGAINDCLLSGEFLMDQLADALGRSVQWVKDRIDLVSWPDDVTRAVHLGKLSVSAARNLSKITDFTHRALLVDYAIENGATARTTAAWFQAWSVGAMVDNPGDIQVEAGRDTLPPIVPYTPCVICGRQGKMTELTYVPICPECSELVLGMAREVRQTNG